MVDVAQLVEPRIVIPAVAGSSPVVHPTFGVLFVEWFIGPLAQLVEQLTLNQLVVGSIPTRPTNSIKVLRSFFRGRSLASTRLSTCRGFDACAYHEKFAASSFFCSQ
jgi:hypothetical protein